MSATSDPSLSSAVIYSVFVRNHTAEGTFRAVIPDLPRIQALGTDIVWFMPIHPIGKRKRKGSLGSPYSISDYRAVNPEYGTEADLRALVDAIHALGMRCMIDVVYNHTSADSVLAAQHPEFFHKGTDGRPVNRIADWTDVIDLDYSVPALWEYQIETLRYWAGIVDGFRCDVASLVPAAFWERARKEVAEVNPSCIWLAETVHLHFNTECRKNGIPCAIDTELFSAFDMEYDYDIREAFDRYLNGKAALSHWLDLVCFQDFAYPPGYNKLRFLENHDVPRSASRAKNDAALQNLTAMLYFLKGTTLLYAGQENACAVCPGLFDKDPVKWNTGTDLSGLLAVLGSIKKDHLEPDDLFIASGDDLLGIALMERASARARKIGIFSLQGRSGTVRTDLPDGTYTNLIDGSLVRISQGIFLCGGLPVILSVPR